MAKRAPMPMAQTFIEVPPSPNAKAELTEEDKARAYEELMGREAAERQRALAALEKTCTCGEEERRAAKGEPPPRLGQHRPGCHLIPLKHGRKAA